MSPRRASYFCLLCIFYTDESLLSQSLSNSRSLWGGASTGIPALSRNCPEEILFPVCFQNHLITKWTWQIDYTTLQVVARCRSTLLPEDVLFFLLLRWSEKFWNILNEDICFLHLLCRQAHQLFSPTFSVFWPLVSTWCLLKNNQNVRISAPVAEHPKVSTT